MLPDNGKVVIIDDQPAEVEALMSALSKEKVPYVNTKPAFLYVSDAAFRLEGVNYILLFDFRFLHSLIKVKTEIRKPSFRLKQQLLSDIQIKLGSHINRAGVVFVD